MKRLLLAIVCLLIAGSPAPSVAADLTGSLKLTSACPNDVSGTYSKDGLTVTFSSTTDGPYGDAVFSLSSPGLELIQLESIPGGTRTSYLNRTLQVFQTDELITWYMSQEDDLPPGEKVIEQPGLKVVGDPAVLGKFMQRPELAILPHLSRALGATGITGYGYPASSFLHQLGQLGAEMFDVQLEPLEKIPEGPCGGSLAPPECWPGCELPGCGNGDCELGEWCHVCEDDCGVCPPAPGSCSARHARPCVDMRSNPCNDGCYGLCGLGCACWHWVCGNCCYHPGCAFHDSACRSCHLAPWTWGNCLVCGSIGLITAPFGC